MTEAEKTLESKDGCRDANDKLAEISLQVPEHLAVAFQRCSWVLVQEKGQSKLETMEEMVRDFLIKHGC